jgi:hypothetical protein
MWESPVELWRRLRLGREEYLQRLITTLIAGGEPPGWNTSISPSEQGGYFLQQLDEVAYGNGSEQAWTEPEAFVDEYLLPKLEEAASNGWPDWAVLWADRTWVIELKTEAASHREDQLPYYLLLAAAAHPRSRLDLTYITGPLTKPAPRLLPSQRYTHLTWAEVLPLIEGVWGSDHHPQVAAYVSMVRTVIGNLDKLRPAEQRTSVVGQDPKLSSTAPLPDTKADRDATVEAAFMSDGDVNMEVRCGELLEMARSTATDGRQRGVGAANPTDLEVLRDKALAQIDQLPPDDATRFVLPWLWTEGQTGGRALTPEGAEFGHELRFSRYKRPQVRP